jgi:hypothetical protein
MTVTDIFHDIHLPVDKTSIVTARGSAVVSRLAMSKKKFQKQKILFLPTDPILFWPCYRKPTIYYFFGVMTACHCGS